jgi:hypothetical protein
MKILSSSRYLPQRIQEQSQVQNVTAPSFKASKAQIAESLGKEITKNLGLSGNKLKSAKWTWNIYKNVEKSQIK